MSDEEMMRRLVLNAIDFLQQANADFNTKPKHSVINFYSAVELMLKARLFEEHWTLVVSKQTTRRKFEEGDFVSVTFEDAVQRLRDIIGSPLSENAVRSFNTVRLHRNKMVHFFHVGDNKPELEKIAAEQLRAWYYLIQLLTTTWRDVFAPYAVDINPIEKSLTTQREYLGAKFNDLKPQLAKLKAEGTTIAGCNACGFKAASIDELLTDMLSGKCLVCGSQRTWINIECECGRTSEFNGDGASFVCPHCHATKDVEALVERLNEEHHKPDEATLAVTPANCGECEGYQTVIERDGQYVCLQCIDVSETLEQCEWCSEHNTGDMSDSYLLGCGNCDGHSGWHKDD